jgi:hypothetical protein
MTLLEFCPGFKGWGIRREMGAVKTEVRCKKYPHLKCRMSEGWTERLSVLLL